MIYLTFDRLTGEILQTGECLTDDYLALETPSVGVLSRLSADLATQYVDTFADPVQIVSKPARPNAWSHWDWTTHNWVVDLAKARSDKAGAMESACKAVILSGFKSSALGAEHHYPAKMTDQQNLASSVLASLLPIPPDWVTPFWCADSADVWEFRLHTAAQIQQVGQDAKAAILAAMGRNEQLQAEIASATTLDQLEEITW